MKRTREILLMSALLVGVAARPALAESPPQPGQMSHSFTSQDVEESDPPLALPSGATVDKIGSSGRVTAKWCPGKETNPGAHGPHESVEVADRQYFG